MNTPICDFVKKYSETNALRLHVPGHKGKSLLGFEELDITEISGADSLFHADGIIAESEKNASELFGSDTYFSTEGSSHCIRAMLYLAKLWGENPLIIAARNAHKAFLSAVALLDTETVWLNSVNESYLSASIDLNELENTLIKANGRKTAVYLTSPDYLGNVADIKSVSEICKKHSALLLVDNAHGAYLKFLPQSKHPIDLGADICCDSAHKTFPVLTGGAYLHISKSCSELFSENAKNALALFGSTSPSYLILQSLDFANKYISEGYRNNLASFISEVEKAKERIGSLGYKIIGNEPLKIVIETKKYGYLGHELAEILQNRSIICEFADIDHIVFMLTPENNKTDLEELISVLESIPRKAEIKGLPPRPQKTKCVLTPRQAFFAESETIDARLSSGRILAEFNIACPPAVPILVCGEVIDEKTIECFNYYGIEKIRVIK